MSILSSRWIPVLALVAVCSFPARSAVADDPSGTSDRDRAVAAALESSNLRMRAKIEEAGILDRQGRHDAALAALRAVEGVHTDAAAFIERLLSAPDARSARGDPSAGRRRASPTEITIPTVPVVADSLRRLVTDATDYLLSVQRADGWFREEPIAGASADTHLDVVRDLRPTALAVLALTDALAFHDEQGRVTASLGRGVEALLQTQDAKGRFGVGELVGLEDHALSTWAVAAGLSRVGPSSWNSDVRSALDRALAFSLGFRGDRGLWLPGTSSESGDWIVTAWMAAAIHEIVALPGTEESRVKWTAALDLAQAGARGLEFKPGDDVEPAARFARALLVGMPNERTFITGGSTAPDRSLVTDGEEVALLLGTTYRFGRSEGFLEWRERVLDPERRRQHRDGPLAGSWNPVGFHALAHGRTFATACQLLAALVPYVPPHDPKGE